MVTLRIIRDPHDPEVLHVYSQGKRRHRHLLTLDDEWLEELFGVTSEEKEIIRNSKESFVEVRGRLCIE